ncbi:hypothetical protein CP981_18780 [Streptomyces platensis]|nr:hypothetical protein [Streptomyces platensis]QEV53429.1 hypothetical protein CP981_18780 [Streptomyces platensis]
MPSTPESEGAALSFALQLLPAVAALAGFAIPGAYAGESQGEVEISNVVLDGGKDFVVDTYDKTVLAVC